MRFSVLLFAYCITNFVFAQSSSVKERIAIIQSEVPLEYNKAVHSYINQYLSNTNNSSSEMLERFRYFEPRIDSVFKANKIPSELKFLSLALSGCTNGGTYMSEKSGMFHVPKGIAKKHNTVINRYIDNRRDPVVASELFAKEVAKNYSEYSNWKDAILAYLAGADVYESYKLDESVGLAELNTYYKYVAVSYLAYFHESHRIFASKKYPVNTAKVEIKQLTTLYQLSHKLGMDYEVLKELNAKYMREIVPSNQTHYVTVPEDKVLSFHSKGEDVYNYSSVKTYTATELKFAGKTSQLVIAPGDSILDETGTELIYHVRKDDILIKIADYFDCDIVQIIRWNDLKSDYLDIDQPLIIKVPPHKFKYYSRVDLMTREERIKHAAKD